MHKRIFLKTCCAISLSLHNATAMVIGESLSNMISIPRINPTPNVTAKRFRLRRTSSSDLDDICNLLATESLPSSFMHRLRAKSSFNQQLSHRLQAIDVGRRTYRNLKQLDDECSIIDNYNVSNLLSVNGEFKTIIKKALSNSSEPNAWEKYRFDTTTATTKDSGMLHHVMITIEDNTSGDVVGFCEIGYLEQMQRTSKERMNVSGDSLEIPPMPQFVDFSCGDRHSYAPAILNLVVSPSHRRLGLASRLVNFALKYTRTQLRQQDSNVKLGLYVHPDNHSAVNLYTRKGFEIVTESKEGLIYMTV